MTSAEPSLSADVVARYAADAARDAPGVRRLVEGHLHRHRGVRVLEEDGDLRVELRIEVAWDASIPDVGRDVQRRVGDYLRRMAHVQPVAVDVVVAAVGKPG